MVKIVRVTNLDYLPSKAQGKVTSDAVFNVVKEDTENYLLEMPHNCGGHTSASSVPAYWVHKSYCQTAYKAGQRWQYKDWMIIEFTEDRLSSNARVVQILNTSSYSVGEAVSTQSIETAPENWVYLQGQDKPTT